MGLSIYYRLKTKTDADGARRLVKRLHALVKKLPFDEVSEIFEHDPPDGKYVFTSGDDDEGSRRWKPGDLYLTRRRADGQTENVHVPSLHVVCFAANVKGSETAMFGLASHPPVVVHREEVITAHPEGGTTHHIGAGEPVEFPTRLRGWYSWSGFTKTQYAANPRLGGVANFLRAHLSVFHAVDHAKKLGIDTHIRDDGKYWRHRDEGKLVAELMKWDELIAGFAGHLSDKLGNAPGAVVAPIKDRPDFEHLEAKGVRRMKNSKNPRSKRRQDDQ